ncbi:MAG TPA: riboflavin synthase [Thiomicrospira sp.]|jgi:riboflavin synthase|nr:riboflavin synthase [Thiomicrospira sp.]
MFTGIIESVGKIVNIEQVEGDARYTIDTNQLDMSDVKLGDSIACNGVCLTAIELGANFYVADVSSESLKVTTLGALTVGSSVNLEKALRLQDRLGGHLVSGHVDGVGEVVSILQEARSSRYQIKAPANLAKYIAEKGSICINGISLTVNGVESNVFDVNIVPHTKQKTTIVNLTIGSQVNLEVDLLARYLERMMNVEQNSTPKSNVTEAMLAKNGFI